MTLKLSWILEVVEVNGMQNFIKPSAAIHELTCPQACPILQCWIIRQSGPVTLTLKLSGFRAVVKEHVGAKFHQAQCSGSRVIVRTEKKTMKTILSVATERTERTASGHGYAESTAFLHRKNAGQLYFSNISSVSFSRLARMFH